MTRGGVLITGATSGIGAAVARDLAGQGFRVFGTIRRPEDEAALVAGGSPTCVERSRRIGGWTG